MVVLNSVGNHFVTLLGNFQVSVFTAFGHYARLEFLAPDPLSFLDPLFLVFSGRHKIAKLPEFHLLI